jgi:hypothetical protein
LEAGLPYGRVKVGDDFLQVNPKGQSGAKLNSGELIAVGPVVVPMTTVGTNLAPRPRRLQTLGHAIKLAT